MAILDRPMFQRPLTKDQLRQYGIPAFANGGVVQRFANGGDANTPNFREPINVKEKFDTATTEMLDVDAKQEAIQQGRFFSPVSTLEDKIANLERKINLKKQNGQDTTAEEAELAQLKSQLAEEKVKKAEATADSTPVPTELTDALKTGDTEKVRETLLTQEGPGQDIEIKTKIEEQENDRDPLGPEKDKLSELEALVRERSDIYKKILGDPREGLKQQGLLQLAQFGLNLASARGGTFAEKIAKSAKDPLQTFAALGREALKDERAIDMLAIKGAEDEMARTQKVGTFGQLVQDLMNSKGIGREEAVEEAIKITTARSGKTVAEMKNEAYKEYLRFYEAELGAGDEARNKANKAIEEDFGTPMFTPEEPEVKRAT